MWHSQYVCCCVCVKNNVCVCAVYALRLFLGWMTQLPVHTEYMYSKYDFPDCLHGENVCFCALCVCDLCVCACHVCVFRPIFSFSFLDTRRSRQYWLAMCNDGVAFHVFGFVVCLLCCCCVCVMCVDHRVCVHCSLVDECVLGYDKTARLLHLGNFIQSIRMLVCVSLCVCALCDCVHFVPLQATRGHFSSDLVVVRLFSFTSRSLFVTHHSLCVGHIGWHCCTKIR